MKKAHSSDGFTLFEVLIALMIFSMAVIALVGAINGVGNASVEARRNREIVAKLESLLTEITRMPVKPGTGDSSLEKTVSENGVAYHITKSKAVLSTQDDQALKDMYSVKGTARWNDGGRPEEIAAETLVYPQLYAPAL